MYFGIKSHLGLCVYLLSFSFFVYPTPWDIMTLNGIQPLQEQYDMPQKGYNVTENPKNLTIFAPQLRVAAHYFNRGSDTLLILGSGFPDGKESMKGIARHFTAYDVVSFDYRWSSPGYFTQFSTIADPITAIVKKEIEEVIAVVNHFRAKGTYKQIVGLGFCFSAGSFAMAQAHEKQHNRPLFDKLILDSPYLSVHDFMREILKDPLLPLHPQEGGSPEWVQKFLGWVAIHKTLMALGSCIVPDFSLISSFQAIRGTPILCIYGTKDRMVPKPVFNTIWSALKAEHTYAIITPHEHSSTYYNERERYVDVCSRFIETGNVV